MTRKVIVKNNIDPSKFKPGDNFSKQYKVIKIEDNHLVIGRTFKNGNPKKMSLKYVFTR